MVKIIKFTSGSVVFKTDQGGTYEIDGEKLYVGYNDRVVIPAVPKIVNRITERSVIVSYSSESGETISADEYNETIKKLDKSDEDGVFSDLDEQYEFLKFKRNFCTPDRETVVEKSPEEICLFECLSIEDEYKDCIFSLYHSPNYKYEEHLVNISVNVEKFIAKIAEEFGFSKVGSFSNTKGFSYSHNDGGRYLQVNGKYLCENSPPVSNYSNITYSKAKEIIDSERNNLRKHFREQKLLIEGENKKLSEKTFTEIYDGLNSLSRAINGIDPKKSSLSSFRRVKTQISNLLESMMRDEDS